MSFIDPEVGKKVALLRQEAKFLNDKADELLNELGLNKPGVYISGDYLIKVRPTVRFDAPTAERNLSPEEFKSILKEKPDSALAKAVLGDDKYKMTQKTYGVTRTVERVEDE